MKAQRYHSVGLAVLSSVLALLSCDVIASSSTRTLGCMPDYVSDGDCDEQNNTEDCGYDGGDCCFCTCEDAEFTCGENGGFGCLDPSAPCFGEETTISSSLFCVDAFTADGDCDDINNTRACGYDGGDCCECTCNDTAEFDCGDSGFTCLDPDASCFENDDITTDDLSTSTTTVTQNCIPDFFSDGDCDLPNNTEECGYDGGDCCECTCVTTDNFTCGDARNGGFACLDPMAPCVDDDDITVLPTTEDYSDTATTTSQGCFAEFMSDGDCDLQNNNEDCDYDGGDCCECTCVSTAAFTCGDGGNGGFSCLDPSAACVDDDDVTTLPTTETFSDSPGTTTDTPCSSAFISDGDCDEVNNNEECGYDGGDCCECTCVSTVVFTCGLEAFGGFACIDPNAPCVDDDDFTPTFEADDFFGFDDDEEMSASYSFLSFLCIQQLNGDGACDPDQNIEECGYDGGDCCECTCDSDQLPCGSNGDFYCIDPRADCSMDDVDANPEAGIKKTAAPFTKTAAPKASTKTTPEAAIKTIPKAEAKKSVKAEKF